MGQVTRPSQLMVQLMVGETASICSKCFGTQVTRFFHGNKLAINLLEVIMSPYASHEGKGPLLSHMYCFMRNLNLLYRALTFYWVQIS